MSGQTFEDINPWRDEEICQVSRGMPEDIDIAVKAAQAALESGPWAEMGPS